MAESAWLYGLDWIEEAPERAPEERIEGVHAVFLDADGVGAELVERLCARSLRCIAFAGPQSRLPNVGSIIALDPADGESFRSGVGAALQGEGHVHAVYLWGCDASDARLEASHPLISARVVDLVRLLAVEASIDSSTLWLGTRGVSDADGGSPRAAAQAVLWGLGRVIRFEHPELRCRRVDLDPASSEAASAALEAELRHGDIDRDGDEIALLGGRRYVPRLRKVDAERPARAFVPRPDATYLVTGGHGLLGLKLIDWLCARGARHIHVASRRPPSSRAAQRLERLRDGRVRIKYCQADVSDAAAVTALVADIARSGLPLAGAFHLAGTFGDSDLIDLTESELAGVIGARAYGAIHLDAATRELDLDCFVLFGSSVALLGAPGQGAFAAANAVLSAVATRRRRLGRAATCVSWGPWTDDEIDAGGVMAGFAPAAALELLGQRIMAGGSDVVALPQDLARLLEFYPRAGCMAVFRELADARELGNPGYTRGALSTDYMAPRDRIERIMVSVVRRMLALDRVGIRDDFFELGGDSVTGAGILDRVNRLLGTTVTFETAVEAFTVEQLAIQARAELERAEPARDSARGPRAWAARA